MIGGFLQSWSMFGETYLAALLSGLALSLVGVVVVARGQVFLAAAVAQAATLGAATSLVVTGWQPAVGSVGFGLAAALAAGGRLAPRRGHEEATAWVFLVAASLTVLLVAREALGLKQVQAIMASSLIGAGAGDVLVFAGLAAVVVLVVLGGRSRLVLLLSDPTMAAAVGMRVRVWAIGMALVLGLVAGLSIRSSGLLFTFGCLALPPLFARNVCRRTATMFVVSPLVGSTAIMAGLVLAHGYDFPPGQVIVVLMGGCVVLAWGVAALRRHFLGG